MVSELEKQNEIREGQSLKLSDYQSDAVADLLQVVSVAAAAAADVDALGGVAAAVDCGVRAAAAADYQMNYVAATVAEGVIDFELGTEFPLHNKEMKLQAVTVATSECEVIH